MKLREFGMEPPQTGRLETEEEKANRIYRAQNSIRTRETNDATRIARNWPLAVAARVTAVLFVSTTDGDTDFSRDRNNTAA